MEFRNIFIANQARVCIEKSCLVIEREKKTSFPLEDIASVLIESGQVLITSYTLQKMCEYGIVMFVCDSKHMPSGYISPMNCYHRQKKLIHKQINLSKPLAKQLWKDITTKKIQNQAKCLEILGIPGYERLNEFSSNVLSGDTTNLEAGAAAAYFPLLFGKGFTRGADNISNAALDYGYAILRGFVARNLVVHGLEPCLGIHHHNELNNFNLADDIIEPFRPIVDLTVASTGFSGEELLPWMKQSLFNVSNYMMKMEEKNLRVAMAIEECVISLAQSILNDENQISIPQLIKLEEYRYD